MLKKKIMRGAVAALLLAIISPSPLIAEPLPQLEGDEVGNGLVTDRGAGEEGIIQEKLNGWSSSGLIKENPRGTSPLEGITSFNGITDGS